ncbi:hypothetical protein A3Q56_04338 [Intoshia linei]|uniref:Uncharacterized protein n=1 Tax=Intoshia linei TaxID=1819745 RepID=A0A177B0T9_9BILA|nr:hypothetical protein A3Q56_04338 [Intoshia linei]
MSDEEESKCLYKDDLDYIICVMRLSMENSEYLTKKLKIRNMTIDGVNPTDHRIRHSEFLTFYGEEKNEIIGELYWKNLSLVLIK